MIVPPPDVRALIDRILALVAEEGLAPVKALVAENPALYGFLNESDPFFAWFQWRKANPPSTNQEAPDNVNEPVINALPKLSFVYELPQISAKGLATIRLAAEFTVRNPALPEEILAAKPGQFEFLRESHRLHPLFREFVKQYELVSGKVEVPGPDVLQRALLRAEYEQQSESNAAEDKKAFAQINWQDFVVVETVTFDSTRDRLLPAPVSDLRSNAMPVRPKEPTLKSPFTGEQVPASHFDEHIRVHSLDPRYEEQKRKFEERQRSTNLDLDGVVGNLKRLTEDSPQAEKIARTVTQDTAGNGSNRRGTRS